MRLLVAGLLGGLAMFVWSFVAHELTPLGSYGISTLPNESTTVANLASSIGGKAGLYLFPAPVGASASAATAPGGFLVFNPKTPTTLQPSYLVVEFVTEVVESLLAAWLLLQTALATYAMRVVFVGVVGVTGAIVTNVPYWNWYSFPLGYTLGYSLVEVVAFLVAGLVIAAVLRPRTTA
jgi:hypothetical protein